MERAPRYRNPTRFLLWSVDLVHQEKVKEFGVAVHTGRRSFGEHVQELYTAVVMNAS